MVHRYHQLRMGMDSFMVSLLSDSVSPGGCRWLPTALIPRVAGKETDRPAVSPAAGSSRPGCSACGLTQQPVQNCGHDEGILGEFLSLTEALAGRGGDPAPLPHC